MHLDHTPEQQRLRTELRAYFAELVPDNAYARYADPAAQKRFYRATIRRLGADGWLGVGWPEEYGGRGMTAMEQFIFFVEAAQAGVPLPLMALNTVGPTIMRYGTDEQKEYFLPRVLSGEIDFAIGYREPGAGTDLASLTTRAVRDGDTYVVNGQKIWTTNGDTADWVWLAVRTDPQAPPHRGITMLLSAGRLGRQGLRLRGPPGRLRLADGGGRRGGPAEGGLGRRRPVRRTGAWLPLGGHLHLRRRQQRDPARDHLLARPEDAPGAAVGGCDHPLPLPRRGMAGTGITDRQRLAPVSRRAGGRRLSTDPPEISGGP